MRAKYIAKRGYVIAQSRDLNFGRLYLFRRSRNASLLLNLFSQEPSSMSAAETVECSPQLPSNSAVWRVHRISACAHIPTHPSPLNPAHWHRLVKCILQIIKHAAFSQPDIETKLRTRRIKNRGSIPAKKNKSCSLGRPSHPNWYRRRLAKELSGWERGGGRGNLHLVSKLRTLGTIPPPSPLRFHGVVLSTGASSM
jgi:hypothetical protein